MGESPREGNPSNPPPPPTLRAWNLRLPRMEKRQIESPKRQNGPPEWDTGVGGGGRGGNSATFQITQQWSNISRCFFHMELCVSFPLLIAVPNCAHLLSVCCKEESGTLYSEAESIKGRRNYSLALSRLHSILQATSLRRTVYTRTKSATTTNVKFLPLKLLLHKVYISNILCGLRLWVQDIYSKKKPFVSTVHFNL